MAAAACIFNGSTRQLVTSALDRSAGSKPAKSESLLSLLLLVAASVEIAVGLLLEILYLFRLKMFGIDPFTAVVMPEVAVEFGIFAATTYLAHSSRPKLH